LYYSKGKQMNCLFW